MNAERKVIPLFERDPVVEAAKECRAAARRLKGEPDPIATIVRNCDERAARWDLDAAPAAMPANVVPLFNAERMEAAKFQGTRERLRVAAEEIETKRADAARKRRNAALASAAPDIAAIRQRQESAQA